MIAFLLRTRFVWLVLSVVLVAVLIVQDRKVTYEQSIKSFFADDDAGMALYRRASEAFGDDNFVFLVYDDPNLFTPAGIARVTELASKVAPGKIAGVARVESLDAMPLLWKIDDALIALDALPAGMKRFAIDQIRTNLGKFSGASTPLTIASAVKVADAAALADLKSRVTKHPLFRGTLVDASGMTTALVARLKKTDQHDVKDTVFALREACDTFAKSHNLMRPAVVGPPVLLADGFSAIERDGRLLATVGMALIGLVTFAATRSLWWAIIPILAGWLIWLVAESILSRFDLRLSLSGGPLVAQIIVLTMPAASHLAVHFRDEVKKRGDRRLAATAALKSVSVPILWTAVTAAIGYGALVTSTVVPIRQFGLILAICSVLASLVTILFAPSAMMPLFAKGRRVLASDELETISHMGRLIGWVERWPLAIVVVMLGVILPLAAGMTRLRYESNYINAFMPTSRVVQDYGAVESRLGGIGVVQVVVPFGVEATTASLSKFRALAKRLTSGPADAPHADYVLSLDTVLDPDGRFAAMPPEVARRILAIKLELIRSSPQAELMNGFWNLGDGPDRGQARVLIRLVEQQPTAAKNAIFAEALASAKVDFGEKSYLTGLSFLMTRTTEGVIVTQWTTFLCSVAGILLMLTIALRGPSLAVLALAPTLLAVAFVLGLMGWLGIKLDIATALVASVALGLSVDDTFHCLLQFKKARRTMSFSASLKSSYAVSGPGVLLSSSAVALGFLTLRLSEFAPFANFGTMVGIATAGSTVGNLILLPACLALFHRWSSKGEKTAPGAEPVAVLESPASVEPGVAQVSE